MKPGFKLAAMAFGVGMCVAVGGAVLVEAQAPADTIKARQDKMKEIGGANKKNGDAIKEGKIDAAEIEKNALAIHALSKQIVTWFPAGTAQPGPGAETKALPAIWEKQADFKKAADDLGVAVAALAASAKTGDAKAIEAAQGEVGKACGGCHRPFRAEKAS
ncbi:MAG: cytochrome c [Alphaproteobacteria bacterium]|nr:cytochrome c [Alphaproteobacteria bacterium]